MTRKSKLLTRIADLEDQLQVAAYELREVEDQLDAAVDRLDIVNEELRLVKAARDQYREQLDCLAGDYLLLQGQVANKRKRLAC